MNEKLGVIGKNASIFCLYNVVNGYAWRGMFVKMTKNCEDTQYVSIVEGYREKDKVKQRTIESLGKLKDLEGGNPNYLAEFKENVKAEKYQQASETLLLTLDLNKKISNPLRNYCWLLLDEIYRGLGLSKILQTQKRVELKNRPRRVVAPIDDEEDFGSQK